MLGISWSNKRFSYLGLFRQDNRPTYKLFNYFNCSQTLTDIAQFGEINVLLNNIYHLLRSYSVGDK